MKRKENRSSYDKIIFSNKCALFSMYACIVRSLTHSIHSIIHLFIHFALFSAVHFCSSNICKQKLISKPISNVCARVYVVWISCCLRLKKRETARTHKKKHMEIKSMLCASQRERKIHVNGLKMPIMYRHFSRSLLSLTHVYCDC